MSAQRTRRVDLEFGIGYSDDIEKAERILGDIIGTHELVLKSPEPIMQVAVILVASNKEMRNL